MKSTLLSLLLLLSFFANAQFKKGDKFLGGAFAISTQKTKDAPDNSTNNNINSFGASPLMGYFINEKWAVGGQVGYSIYNYKAKNDPDYSYTNKRESVSAGLFAQRYFPISEKFFFSLIGSLEFDRGYNKYTTNYPVSGYFETRNIPYYQLTTAIQPAFIFFPSPKWGIQASVGTLSYSFMRNLSSDSKQNNINLDYGSFSFGLTYYFKRS